ncbi:MAG TPA: hypothetical protein VF676_02220 [Flavobacterium sp.]|jgi:hypothetical protein
MPSLSPNTIAQNSTTSNGGVNVMPKLDASSFYFLEDDVFTQASNKAFGVVDENAFRTTSLVTVASKKVVSICSGQVFLQPQTADPTKVNLILKPYKQPANGLAIKYFIYRGLPKTDFLDGAGNVLTTGSGLITHIRKEFQDFYNLDPTLLPQPPFKGIFIGYPDPAAPTGEAQELADPIDSYFNKISQTFDGETGAITNAKRAFELPMIPAGTHLATVTGEIGFEIVLNYGDYYIENDPNPFKLDLTFARLDSNVINVSGITDPYQKKVMREAITQFIDPAAYYGLHANGGKIYKFGVTVPIETPAAIYTLITPFATKNNIYLYVQSNRQRSYNFYNKYAVSDTNANNIKIGTTEANLVETKFETDKWPVRIFNTAASGTPQTIAVQFTTDRGPNTSLYGDTANIISDNNEGFVDAKSLIQEPDANGVISSFTKTVLLSSPATGNTNIASIIQLIYLGKAIILSKPGVDDGDPNTPAPDPILFTTKYMDDVFDLVNATSFLEADKVYHVHSYKPTLINQQEIEKNRGKVISFTQRTQNTIAISETESLTLFTYLSIVENEQSKHSNFSQNVSANKEATGYAVQNVTDYHTLPNMPGNENIDLRVFTDSEQTVTGITIKTNDGSVPTSMALGITESENDILIGLMLNALNPMVYLSPLNDTANILTAIEDVKYQKYRLGLLIDENDFSQMVTMPVVPVDIIIYSLDGLAFTSKGYGDYIESLFSKSGLAVGEYNKIIS